MSICNVSTVAIGVRNLVKVTFPEGNVVEAQYDEHDLLYRVIGDPGEGYVAETTTYACDGNEKMTKANDPNGHDTTYDYDGYGRPIGTTDALGNYSAIAHDKNLNVTEVERYRLEGWVG